MPRLVLILAALALALAALLLGAAPPAGESVGRAVVYVSPTAGTWGGGVQRPNEPCVSGDEETGIDFAGCCPAGFDAVGYGADSLLACVEDW